MDFHQLKTFCHVARRLNFTRAAEDLNMSQPAVSRQIESLEKTVGLPLFNRLGRGISLTDAGYALYKQGEQILQLVENTQTSIDALKNLEAGSLRIGCSSTVGNYVLPPILLQFAQKYPAIRTQLEIDCTQEMLRQAEKDEVDIAIIAGPVASNVLYLEPLLTDEIVLAIGKNHPLATTQTLSLDVLQQYPLLLRKEGSHSRATILSHFKALGWMPSHIMEFATTEAIKQAILTGFGMGFLSKLALRFEKEYGLLRIMDDPPFSVARTFYLASHKSRHPSPAMLACKTFIKKNRDLQ